LISALFLIAAQFNQRAAADTGAVADAKCPVSVATSESLGSLKVESTTRWQPVDGEIHFRLTELTSQPENVSVWFNWQDAHDQKTCVQSTRVQFISKSSVLGDSTKIEIVYSARLPPLDGDSRNAPWVEGLKHWRFRNVVPLADMYVHANLKDDEGVDTLVLMVDSVGVSTPWLAFVTAIGLVAVAWGFLLSCAAARNVPGGRLLRVISTRRGVASLSQFQIMIWSTVIGAGIIYVMLISGNLIDIPATTLGLLGVTGLTLVGSKVHANSDGTPQRLSPPGLVSNLTVSGTPTSNTVVLSWTPPAGAEQPFSYTVQMRLSGAGSWSTVATDIGAPPYAVTGLAAATSYDFQVFAMNAGGAGPTSLVVPATTLAAAPPGAVGPGQVTGLTARANPEGSVSLQWAALNPAPSAYVVQYRPVGSLPWAIYSNTANTPQIVLGLDAGTAFEFLVIAITGGVAGTPSTVVVATTASRTPQWSDLVMSGDGNVEIDLSRVQMLLFTSIAAAFTGMTLVNTGEIPDIPIGVLGLVGLSNGVYLASKTLGR
jgi:hypothetical protein